jgi:2,5-diamino-6-(ribosylamino)-4(3H)-pyrimidinone 5'-phosphate reductase
MTGGSGGSWWRGGGSLVASLFSHGLVDEFSTFVGDMVIGGREAPTPVDGGGFPVEKEFVRLSLMDVSRLDEGVLLRWRVTHRH